MAAPKATPAAEDRAAQLEAALTETLREIIAERDTLYDCVTCADGRYDDPRDEAEVARLDGIIDRGRAALSGRPEGQPFAAGRSGAPSTIAEAVATQADLDAMIAALVRGGRGEEASA
ncbi:hypothetical protein CCR85_01110 [Rhodothalassium salexigens]|nr:hypothetical protein [Rhodothalassium salexigens]MBK5920705.1 hypothetical protein [Rhodothalassium salexigens]